MKQPRLRWYCLLIGLIFILGGPSLVLSADKLPKMMTWTSYDVGSSGYMMVGHVSTTLYEKHGIKIRVIPAGTDIPGRPARLTAMV